jgi:hypothetical protein
MTPMKLPRSSRGLAAAGVLVLSACASGPEVQVNVDNGYPFDRASTFAFVDPLGTDRAGYQTIVSQYLKAATRRELEARGMRLDEGSPQLLVNFSGRFDEKLRTSTTPVPMTSLSVRGGYYGYRAGIYGAWPAYVDQTTVTAYTEGTLNIDVIDAARKQLVWESVVKDSVTQKTLDNLQASIESAVAAAFEKYPVPAKTPAR